MFVHVSKTKLGIENFTEYQSVFGAITCDNKKMWCKIVKVLLELTEIFLIANPHQRFHCILNRRLIRFLQHFYLSRPKSNFLSICHFLGHVGVIFPHYELPCLAFHTTCPLNVSFHGFQVEVLQWWYAHQISSMFFCGFGFVKQNKNHNIQNKTKTTSFTHRFTLCRVRNSNSPD